MTMHKRHSIFILCCSVAVCWPPCVNQHFGTQAGVHLNVGAGSASKRTQVPMLGTCRDQPRQRSLLLRLPSAACIPATLPAVSMTPTSGSTLCMQWPPPSSTAMVRFSSRAAGALVSSQRCRGSCLCGRHTCRVCLRLAVLLLLLHRQQAAAAAAPRRSTASCCCCRCCRCAHRQRHAR